MVFFLGGFDLIENNLMKAFVAAEDGRVCPTSSEASRPFDLNGKT